MHLIKNKKGTSLIELLVAIAIAAIVLSMIMFFINNAANSFRHTNDEVNLQMQAQTAINQINNLALEAAAEEETITMAEKRYIFKYDNDANGTDTYYSVVYKIEEKKLYLIQADNIADAQTQTADIEHNFMAEYVSGLTITKSSDNKSVTIQLELTLGEKTCKTSRKVKMRNA